VALDGSNADPEPLGRAHAVAPLERDDRFDHLLDDALERLVERDRQRLGRS
jgi:hypothetical protein